MTLDLTSTDQHAYAGLNRLTDMARGLINTESVPTANFAQSWSLDATGNWARFQQTEPAGGASQNFLQSRESNRANEIVDIAAVYGTYWFVPVYDRAGNMVGLPRPDSPSSPRYASYDAWNRLVTISGGTYAYDGLHRRITSGTGTSQRHYYYSASWQVLEERLGTNPDTAPPERQFVWGLRYLDDCVLRDRSPTNNGVLSERLYALQDANWNVTSLVSPAGTVQERYRYAAYGQPTFLSAAFVPLAPNASAFDWETLYCGYRYDRATGLYQVRYRYLHPGLGCWLTRDPAAHLAGPVILYVYVSNAPTSRTDKYGLFQQLPAIGDDEPPWLQEFPLTQEFDEFAQSLLRDIHAPPTSRQFTLTFDTPWDACPDPLTEKILIEMNNGAVYTSDSLDGSNEHLFGGYVVGPRGSEIAPQAALRWLIVGIGKELMNRLEDQEPSPPDTPISELFPKSRKFPVKTRIIPKASADINWNDPAASEIRWEFRIEFELKWPPANPRGRAR